MTITVRRGSEVAELEASGTVRDLLALLRLNPETVLVSVNGTLATEDVALRDGDDVRIIDVVSGG